MQCVRKSTCDSSLSKVGSWKSQENRLLKIRNNSENVEAVVLRPVLESLIYKVASMNACNFIKGRLKHRCFPLNIAKFLRTAFFTERHRWLLARMDNFERFICDRPSTLKWLRYYKFYLETYSEPRFYIKTEHFLKVVDYFHKKLSIFVKYIFNNNNSKQ